MNDVRFSGRLPHQDYREIRGDGMTIALVHFNHVFANNSTTWPDMRTSRWKPNYGDMLVCASLIRQIEITRAHHAGFGASVNAPVERALIRGSTYLHREFDFAAANRTLDSVNAPVAIVGLGAQNPVLDVKFLDDHAGARDFIARLNEKSHSISVRGAFTAEVVARLGGKNIRVTGCPSLFYSLECPSVTVPARLATPARALGVSLHSGLSANIFCHAPKQAREKHGRLIAWAIANAAHASLFEQGVLVEFDIADAALPIEARKMAAAEVIKRINAEAILTPDDLVAHMVSVKSIEEWLARASELDAIAGFRFHGNMVALLQGKPCFYYTYDSRLKEFCDVYRLPQADVTESFSDPVQAMMLHDWADTNTAIARLFSELRTFYQENGFTARFKTAEAVS